jgi:DNA-binding LacI/PurR family transcriptional regulator
VIALNDLSAIGAMRAATEHGLRIPQELSVIGVDDIPLAEFLPVSLSTIAQPLAEMARETVELLLDRMERDRFQGPRQATFATSFVVRESNGLVPRAREHN